MFDSVSCDLKTLSAVCLSGRIRTRQSWPDFYWLCPPMSALKFKVLTFSFKVSDPYIDQHKASSVAILIIITFFVTWLPNQVTSIIIYMRAVKEPRLFSWPGAVEQNRVPPHSTCSGATRDEND